MAEGGVFVDTAPLGSFQAVEQVVPQRVLLQNATSSVVAPGRLVRSLSPASRWIVPMSTLTAVSVLPYSAHIIKPKILAMNSSSFRPVVWLSALLIVSGCSSTEQVFLIQRNVPESPTVVVIPATNHLYQHHFANEIENKVVEAGLRTIERPVITTQEVSQEAALAQQPDVDQAAQQSAEITQTFSGFSETSADYVIQTFAASDQIRIIKRSSSDVLASFTMPEERGGPQTREEHKPIRDALREIGLPVRENSEE